MVSIKMRGASQLEFFSLVRYVNGLKNLTKYHIGLAKDDSGKEKLHT